MFIRTKTIKGTTYAYLVDNTWTSNGSRQTVTEYLGKIIHLPNNQHTNQLNTNKTYKQLIQDLLIEHLQQQGFTQKENTLTKDNTKINLQTHHITHNNKPAILTLNNGHISEHTLFDLQHITPNENPTQTAKNLATALLKTGLTTTPENMAILFEKLCPE